jgi:hypothetical protein
MGMIAMSVAESPSSSTRWTRTNYGHAACAMPGVSKRCWGHLVAAVAARNSSALTLLVRSGFNIHKGQRQARHADGHSSRL